MSQDGRLTGKTAEIILATLLRNKHNLKANVFDSEGFDLIAFGENKEIFKGGEPPYFIQVKCRKNSLSISVKKTKEMNVCVERLGIPIKSFYIAIGLYKQDIRSIEFYIIHTSAWGIFRTSNENSYSFSKRRLENAVKEGEIAKI